MEQVVSPGRKKLRRVAVIFTGTALWAAILFAAAGRLDWTAGWFYVVVSLLALAATGLIVKSSTRTSSPPAATDTKERNPSTRCSRPSTSRPCI